MYGVQERREKQTTTIHTLTYTPPLTAVSTMTEVKENSDSKTADSGSFPAKKDREWLFSILADVIGTCKVKFDMENARNTDRQAWASRIFQGVHEYGSLLNYDVEKRLSAIEKEREEEKRKKVNQN